MGDGDTASALPVPPEILPQEIGGGDGGIFRQGGGLSFFDAWPGRCSGPPLHTSPPLPPVTSRKRKEKTGNGRKDDHRRRDGAFHHRRASFPENQEQKVKQNTQTGGNLMPPVFYAKSKEE